MDIPAIYGHRGASAFALENTWGAFRRAYELNVGIELDVQITKDGVVIVFHDDNLKRLSGRDFTVAEVEFRKIKDLKIGKRGRRKNSKERIPLAYEVFQWAKENAIPLNIELKESFSIHPDGPEILAAMLEAAGDFHLSSFNPELLRKMKKLKPDTEAALVVKNRSGLKKLDNSSWIDSVHLKKRLISDDLIEKLKSMKKNIRVYGIVGKERKLEHISSQVSGIITDYPHRVKEKMRPPN